jgi:hypothetical protein
MIIFLNDDRAYLYWVTHHRRGYVLAGRLRPKFSHLLLHRATCPEIKTASSPRVHWTTGAKFKACSLDRQELEAWAQEETAASAAHCAGCRPEHDEVIAAEPAHLTRLGREILDYVLDAAVIHMEHESPPYRLSIADIAACFAKTPAQIRPALHRLIEDGFLTVQGDFGSSLMLSPRRVVLPTIAAMRMLEAFGDASDAMIDSELAKFNAE